MNEFLGRDWTEISKHFGIDCNNEQEALIKTKAYINSVLMTDKENVVASEIRVFVKALHEKAEGKFDNAPLWKGLLEMKNDYTLLKYTSILIEHMWSS
jgi:hypothetical protein